MAKTVKGRRGSSVERNLPVVPRRISMNPIVHEHIASRYLVNLLSYHYSGVDFSLLSRYVMQPYWNFVIELVPMTIAPNTITLTGFVVGMSSCLIALFYYFVEDGVYPQWMWYYSALTIFVYQTLDAIDGKQARRTGAGSPLGELLDHGCDAFITPFIQISVACALGMPPRMFFAYLFQSSVAFYGAVWEQYSTGTLVFGYVSGPTEGIVLCCTCLLLSGRYGTGIWDTPVIGPYDLPIPDVLTTALGMPLSSFHIETARSVLYTFFTCSWLFTLIINCIHVVCRPTVHGSRFIPYVAGLPMVVMSVLHLLLFFIYPDVHEQYPLVFELSFGLLAAYVGTRMTVARLCDMPFNIFNGYYITSFIVTAGVLAFHCVGPAAHEERYVRPALGPAIIVLIMIGTWLYIHMILSVFTQIANFLGISVFSINSRGKKNKVHGH